jgi:hypothetical protein
MSTSGSFGLKKLIKEQGSIGTFDITHDNEIKMIVANAGPTNTVGVYGKIQGQNNYNLIETIVGNQTKLIDVTFYDFLDIEVITYDSISNYIDVAGSGFIISQNTSGGNSSPSLSSGSIQVSNFPNPANVAVVNSPSVVTPDLISTTPNVSTLLLINANIEYPLVLPVNTKKITIKITDYSAPFKLSFTSGGERFSVPRGCSFYENGLKLISGKNTIYLSSSKSNVTVECLSWA